jgi:hypothetical protein
MRNLIDYRSWTGAFWIALSIVSAGCLPFVTPPARVSVGPATHFDPLPGAAEENSQTGFTALRAATHPLDLVDGAENNWFDFGLGYQAEFPPAHEQDGQAVHGPYLELGAYPLSAQLGSNLTLRGGAYATVASLWRTGLPSPGVGGSLGGLVEISGGADGTFAGSGSDGSVVAGYARGRWGVGLWGSGSLHDFSDGAYRGVAAGLSVRLPLLAGVVCCAWPEFGKHGGGGSARSASSTPRLRRTPAQPRRAQ